MAEPDEGARAAADHHGLDAVYQHEAPRLQRYFRRRLRDHDEAADLVQQVFVKLAF